MFGQVVPDGLIDGFGVGKFVEGLFQVGAEFLVGLRAAGKADNDEVVGQETILGQVIKRGDNLAVSEIPGGSKDDSGGGRDSLGIEDAIGRRNISHAWVLYLRVLYRYHEMAGWQKGFH